MSTITKTQDLEKNYLNNDAYIGALKGLNLDDLEALIDLYTFMTEPYAKALIPLVKAEIEFRNLPLIKELE